MRNGWWAPFLCPNSTRALMSWNICFYGEYVLDNVFERPQLCRARDSIFEKARSLQKIAMQEKAPCA